MYLQSRTHAHSVHSAWFQLCEDYLQSSRFAVDKQILQMFSRLEAVYPYNAGSEAPSQVLDCMQTNFSHVDC